MIINGITRSELEKFITNNLKEKIKATDKVIAEIAKDLSFWGFISTNKPDLKLTPEAITIDSKGRITISNNRKLLISWSDKNGKVMNISADAINKLVTYKYVEQPDFYFGILSGLMSTKENDNAILNAYIGISISWNMFFDINLFMSVGYPGVCGGVSYNFMNHLDLFIGSAIDYDKRLNFILGINTRL